MRLIRLLKNDIAREAGEWVDDNIITEEQAENICARYNVDYHHIKNISIGYRVLVSLGYFFIGLALITLISANWDQLPRELRMFGLIAITVTTQGVFVGQYLKGNQSSAINGFLLGNMFFGASIILISQIYHLGEHMPDGVFWWAIGCLPFALLTNSRALTFQTMILANIWFLLEVNMDFYPVLFPLFIISALMVLIRGKQSILLLLLIIFSLGIWMEYSLAKLWQDTHYLKLQAEHIAVSVSLFIFIYAFSHWLRLKNSVTAKDYASVLALWSLRFTLICMFILSFEAPWKSLIRANWEHSFSMGIIVLAFSVISLLAVAKTNCLKQIAIFITVYLLTLLFVVSSGDINQAVYFQIICNVALIIGGIGLIITGIQESVSHYFFVGVVTILLTAMLRYVDLVGNYIGGALLFMVFATILLGVAKYWKQIKLREEKS
ncbi:MAG: DUF2157 domain-containing protein [Psychromonas sp.]